MYVCICNCITDEMLKEDKSLFDVCGSQCGSCKAFANEFKEELETEQEDDDNS